MNYLQARIDCLNARKTRVQRTSKQINAADTDQQKADIKRRNALLETEIDLITFCNQMQECDTQVVIFSVGQNTQSRFFKATQALCREIPAFIFRLG